jgi:hypothetical protein
VNKHHAAKARETLLKSFLWSLETGLQNRKDAPPDLSDDAILNRKNSALVLPGVSNDTARLVIEGIRRALDDQEDPFNIRPPRGIKPKLNRAQWHLLGATVADRKSVV